MKSQNSLKNSQNMNIALIGHMGSGKTILGKLIARKIKFKHIDTDGLIEKNSKKKIHEIFNQNGENSFRKIEEMTILNLTDKKDIVLSLGGGSILSNKTRTLLREKFTTVFLDVEISVLVDRLEKSSSKRPLLMGINIEDKLKKIDNARRKYYLFADIILKNQGTVEEALKSFIKEYNKLNEKNY